MDEVAGEHRVRGIRFGFDRCAPRGYRIAALGPQARQPQVEVDGGALGIELRELLDAIQRSLGPGREGRPDLGLERVVPREGRCCPVQLALSVERGAALEVACFPVVAEAERE